MSDDDLADLGLDDVDLLDIDGAGDLLDELDDLGLDDDDGDDDLGLDDDDDDGLGESDDLGLDDVASDDLGLDSDDLGLDDDTDDLGLDDDDGDDIASDDLGLDDVASDDLGLDDIDDDAGLGLDDDDLGTDDLLSDDDGPDPLVAGDSMADLLGDVDANDYVSGDTDDLDLNSSDVDTSASSAGALGGDGGIDDSIVTDDGEGGADGPPGAGTSDGPLADVATASTPEDGQGFGASGTAAGSDDGSDADMAEAVRDLDREVQESQERRDELRKELSASDSSEHLPNLVLLPETEETISELDTAMEETLSEHDDSIGDLHHDAAFHAAMHSTDEEDDGATRERVRALNASLGDGGGPKGGEVSVLDSPTRDSGPLLATDLDRSDDQIDGTKEPLVDGVEGEAADAGSASGDDQGAVETAKDALIDIFTAVAGGGGGGEGEATVEAGDAMVFGAPLIDTKDSTGVDEPFVTLETSDKGPLNAANAPDAKESSGEMDVLVEVELDDGNDDNASETALVDVFAPLSSTPAADEPLSLIDVMGASTNSADDQRLADLTSELAASQSARRELEASQSSTLTEIASLRAELDSVREMLSTKSDVEERAARMEDELAASRQVAQQVEEGVGAILSSAGVELDGPVTSALSELKKRFDEESARADREAGKAAAAQEQLHGLTRQLAARELQLSEAQAKKKNETRSVGNLELRLAEAEARALSAENRADGFEADLQAAYARASALETDLALAQASAASATGATEASVSVLEDRLKQSEAAHEEAERALAAMETQLASRDSEVAALRAFKTETAKQMDDLRENLAHANDMLERDQEGRAAVDAQFRSVTDSLDQDRAAAVAEAERLRAEVARLEAALASAGPGASAAAADLEMIRGDLADEHLAKQELAKQKREAVAALEKERAKWDAERASLLATRTSLENEVSGLRQEVAGLRSAGGNAGSDMVSHAEVDAMIEREVASLEKAIEFVRRQKQEAETALGAERAVSADLQARVDTAASQKALIDGALKAARTRASTAEAASHQMESDLAASRREASTLRATVARLEADLAAAKRAAVLPASPAPTRRGGGGGGGGGDEIDDLDLGWNETNAAPAPESPVAVNRRIRDLVAKVERQSVTIASLQRAASAVGSDGASGVEVVALRARVAELEREVAALHDAEAAGAARLKKTKQIMAIEEQFKEARQTELIDLRTEVDAKERDAQRLRSELRLAREGQQRAEERLTLALSSGGSPAAGNGSVDTSVLALLHQQIDELRQEASQRDAEHAASVATWKTRLSAAERRGAGRDEVALRLQRAEEARGAVETDLLHWKNECGRRQALVVKLLNEKKARDIEAHNQNALVQALVAEVGSLSSDLTRRLGLPPRVDAKMGAGPVAVGAGGAGGGVFA